MYAVDPSAPHDKFMCELNKLGICEGCYILDAEAPKCYTDAMFTRAMMIYNAFAGFSVGNENNLGKLIEKSAPCVKALIRDVRTYADKCNGSLRPVPIGLDNADIDTPTHPRASWLGYYDCLKDGNENTRAEWYCCYLFQIDKFYLTPDNCDHDAIPCTYSKYPEFDHLAQAYNTTKPSALTLKSFEPTRKESMACPADFPTVPLPARPNVKIFECSVYQPQCNGGSSNKQVTVQPDASTAAPKKPFGPASAPTSAPADPSTPGSNDASSAALTMAAVGVCAAMVQFV
ncbi:hypothetical protein DYB38_005719 [Aphanomyces astaci]|uniref:Uncharacterized protein n=1 Tax=Aphanomyces astaci TaxID=112090 RepID=A0A397DQ23_APHAT|nr:hypothetical protein DYB38_005719 [Aphanomyces astaci]